MLVLEVLPVEQNRNTPDVKYFIGKDLSWNDLETSFYFRQIEASLLLDSLVSLSSLVSAAHLALSLPLLFLNPQSGTRTWL